ncbi:MAG: PKD domain-containing protein [Bacteroidota bacterium]
MKSLPASRPIFIHNAGTRVALKLEKSPLQTGFTATGLCPGTYGVTVSDANGCKDTTSVTTGEPDIITLTTSAINAHCGLADGSATVTATGGNGLYGYLWNDLLSQNTATAIDLLAGVYSVTVTDILGCPATATTTVNDLPPGTATISSTTDVSCFGSNDGTATVSMAGGAPPYTYLWNNPGSQTTITATGLSIGSHNVNVTDTNGCVVSATATINTPIILSNTTLSDSASCNGSCDGNAYSFPSGGTPPYSYQWNDPLLTITYDVKNLCAGIYNVLITDANGCTFTDSVMVEEPLAIVLSEFHSDAHCGQNDGIATISVSGGTGPYSYLWTPGNQTTAFISNVFAGTYIVTITDANGCQENTPVTIADLDGPTAIIINSDSVTCNGGNDGLATVSVSGGTFPFTYQWDDIMNQTAPTAVNLLAGTYIVTIKDNNNCITSASVTIYEPAPILFNPSSTNPACFDSCDGSAGVIVAGGTPPYTYLWNDPASQTTATATNLCTGIYNIIITDANGCIKIGNFVISNPPPMTVSTTSTDESCFGSCDGTATASTVNGTAPYTYQWNDGQTTTTAGSLCADTFNVVLTDANGCTATATAIVGTPPILTASITSSGNIDCNGNCIGFAQSFVTGGTPPYTYLWSDGQTNAQAINLCAGIYDLNVTDNNGCTATASVIITEPQPLVANTTSNNVTCYGDCDGDATVSVSGGVSPYSYQWNDPLFHTTPVADNLCNGVYIVTVADANGCIETANVIITQPQILGLYETVSPSTCGFNNGQACVNVIGGVAPYVITWDDPFTTVGSCIFNAYADVYNPIVYDANGCSYTMPVIINDITGPDIDSISINDVTCSGDANGTAEVFASGVSPPLTYIWENSSSIMIDSGVTFISGLSGGIYTVTVTDANGCITSNIIPINEPTLLASAIISSTDASCNGDCDGTAVVMVGGGVAPYTYLWTDGQTTPTATGLCWGIHNVIITDIDNCITTNTVIISEPDPIVINDSVINVSCNGNDDGAIYLDVQGGTPFYSYSWAPPGTGNSTIVTNLYAGPYIVTVSDIHGCAQTDTIQVNEPTPLSATDISYASTCGYNNGTAIIITSGGTLPYFYLWDDPLATTNDTVIDLFPRDPYYVIITDANGCSLTYPVTVDDIPGPVISVSPTHLYCNGDNTGTATVTSTGTTIPVTYLWDDPLGQTDSIATGLASGPISVTVTDTNGCFDIEFTVVTQPNLLEVITIGDTTICYSNYKVEIFAIGNGGTPPYTYIWNNNLDSIQSHIVNPDSTTIYTVYVIDANGCISSYQSITITVKPPLSVTTSNFEICIGDTTDIVATASGGTGGPYTYSWQNGGPTDTIGIIPNLILTDDTTFTVIVSDGCSHNDSASITVRVNPVPTADFSFTGGGCEPSVFISFISDTSGIIIIEWLWDFGDSSYSNEPYSTSHNYTIAGTYDAALTVTSDKGCSSTIEKPGKIIAFAKPIAKFVIMQNGVLLTSGDTTSILSPTVNFIDSSSNDVVSWEWDFGDPESSMNNFDTIQNPSHTYGEPGTYIITLTVETDSGCPDTYIDSITLNPEYTFFVPNAFTPNEDTRDRNEYFLPIGLSIDNEDFEMYIFDRWGDMIFKYTGSYDGWDGWDGRANNGNKVVQQDVYVWLIKTLDSNGDMHEYLGHVTVIR